MTESCDLSSDVPHFVESVPYFVESVPHFVESVPHFLESVPRVVEVEEEKGNDFPWPPLVVIDKWNPNYPHNMDEDERLQHELKYYSHTFPYWSLLPFVPQPPEPYFGEPKVTFYVPRHLALSSEEPRSIVKRSSCFIQRAPDFKGLTTRNGEYKEYNINT